MSWLSELFDPLGISGFGGFGPFGGGQQGGGQQGPTSIGTVYAGAPGAPQQPPPTNFWGSINGTSIPQAYGPRATPKPNEPPPVAAPGPLLTPKPNEPPKPWHEAIQMGGSGTGIFGGHFGIPGAPTGSPMYNRVPGAGGAAQTTPAPTQGQFAPSPPPAPSMQIARPWTPFHSVGGSGTTTAPLPWGGAGQWNGGR